MTVTIKHDFVSLKGDGSDLTQVQPSNWNANHVLTQASGKVLGRVTAGVGATEEIDWSAFGRSWLNAANASAALGLLGPVSSIAQNSVGQNQLKDATAAARVLASNINPALTVTGAANNGVGLIRLTVASTATFATGQVKKVSGVTGTTEANGVWTITVVDSTHIDLQGSVFANNYLSGGIIGGGFEEHTISDILDFIGSIARGDVVVRGASVWQRVPRGTQGQVLRSDGLDTAFGTIPLLHVREEQPANTQSASGVTPAAWNTLVLNTTKTNEITSASLGSNQITLPAGTYEIEAYANWYAPASAGTAGLKTRLRNITDGTTALDGLNQSIVASGGGAVAVQCTASLRGRFTLAATKVLELQMYRLGSASAALALNQGTEVYTDVQIKRVG